MVSAVLLVVLATASYSVIDQSAGRSASNRARAVAVSLAEQDQARMRAMPQSALESLNETNPRSANGVVYSIQSRAQLTSDSTGDVTCSAGTGAAQYSRIKTTVTWPNMNGIDPVVLDSLVSPPVGGVGRGTVVVTLTQANGAGTSGITVNVAGQSKVTDTSGCALFTSVPPGAHTVTFDQPGYVDDTGSQSVSKPVTVVIGESSSVSQLYDLAATIPTTFRLLGTSTNTPWPSASYQSGNNPVVVRTGSTNPLTADKLFPFSTGYQVYAGNCNGMNPGIYNTSFFTTNPGAVAAPGRGASATAFAYMRRTTIAIAKTSSTTLSNRQPGIEVEKKSGDARMAACPTVIKARYLGNAASSSTSSNNVVDLPYGVYTICVDDNRGGSSVKKSIDIYNTPAGTASPYAPSSQTPSTISLNSGTTSGTC